MVSSMKRRTIALLFCVTWSLRLQHRFARIVPLLSGPARPYRAGAPSFAQFAKGGYHERMRNRLSAEEQELRRHHRHPPAANLLMQRESGRQSCLKIDWFSGDGVLKIQKL